MIHDHDCVATVKDRQPTEGESFSCLFFLALTFRQLTKAGVLIVGQLFVNADSFGQEPNDNDNRSNRNDQPDKK